MRRKIKIAYIIDSINPVAGTEKQIIQMLQNLNEDLFDTKLICLRKPSAGLKIDKKPFEYVELDLNKLISLKALGKLIWLISYLRKESIDIVQTYFFDGAIIGVLAAKIARVGKIISCRRDVGFWYDRKILRILILLNRFVDKFLVNSEAVKESIINHERVLPSKIDVIYNGVDLGRIDEEEVADIREEFQDILESDKVVGIIANLNRVVKRVDLFVRAAADVVGRLRNVKFLILGGGELEVELRKLARDLNVENTVIFGGMKTNAISYIKGFDVGVLTSDSEGFSNAILEYMAVGIPTIATSVGGNRELIENGRTGFLVPRGDYKAIAREICSLLSDNGSRAQIGKEARRVVREKYSWETKIHEIESYYYCLLENSCEKNNLDNLGESEAKQGDQSSVWNQVI